VTLDGAFKSIAPDTLALTDPAARELKIPLSTIANVVRSPSGDRLTNGVVIGTSIGLGVAIAVLAASVFKTATSSPRRKLEPSCSRFFEPQEPTGSRMPALMAPGTIGKVVAAFARSRA
jgi:hypothetical protein